MRLRLSSSLFRSWASLDKISPISRRINRLLCRCKAVHTSAVFPARCGVLGAACLIKLTKSDRPRCCNAPTFNNSRVCCDRGPQTQKSLPTSNAHPRKRSLRRSIDNYVRSTLDYFPILSPPPIKRTRTTLVAVRPNDCNFHKSFIEWFILFYWEEAGCGGLNGSHGTRRIGNRAISAVACPVSRNRKVMLQRKPQLGHDLKKILLLAWIEWKPPQNYKHCSFCSFSSIFPSTGTFLGFFIPSFTQTYYFIPFVFL